MHLPDLLREETFLAERVKTLRASPEQSFPVLEAKIKLTWRCNLRCAACLLWLKALKADVHLEETWVMKSLSELTAQGLRKVHFSGGEVFTYPGLHRVVRHARDLELQVNLTTNGTLLSREEVRFLLDARVHTVNLSLDSANPVLHDRMRGVKGAWKATWKGLHRLLARSEMKGRGPHVAVNTLVTRESIDELPALFELLVASGVHGWRLLPVRTQDRSLRPTDDQWRTLVASLPTFRTILSRDPIYFKEGKTEKAARRARKGQYAGTYYAKHICYAPFFNLFIDADGTVSPCCSGKGELPSYGRIGTTSLDALLSSRERRDLCARMAFGTPFETCHRCSDFLEENATFQEFEAERRAHERNLEEPGDAVIGRDLPAVSGRV